MSEEKKKLDMQDLENAAGGNAGAFGPVDDVHNLAYYDEHVVAHLPEGVGLVMKSTHGPNGIPMAGHAFYNGDRIWVHNRYWEGRCFLAYDGGDFGYVDARYVD